MRSGFRGFALFILHYAVFVLAAGAQVGNSGSIEGVVKDPSGATVANASVEISNPVSGYLRTTTSGADGTFRFSNVPFNPYHMTVTVSNFAPYTKDVEVRSGVPL